MTTTSTLDARGLNCPLPILRTKKALDQLIPGDTLQVLASDPGSVKDLQSFCDQTGDTMISNNTEGSDFVFVIEKA